MSEQNLYHLPYQGGESNYSAINCEVDQFTFLDNIYHPFASQTSCDKSGNKTDHKSGRGDIAHGWLTPALKL